MEIQHQKLSIESQKYPEEDVTLFKELLSEQANKSLYHFLIPDKKGENGEYFVLTHNQKIVREVFYFIFFIAEYSTQGEPSF